MEGLGLWLVLLLFLVVGFFLGKEGFTFRHDGAKKADKDRDDGRKASNTELMDENERVRIQYVITEDELGTDDDEVKKAN